MILILVQYKETRETQKVVTGEVNFAAVGTHGERKMDAICTCISVDEKTGISRHSFILVDRTEQKRLEVELAQHRNTLEEVVRVRTHELEMKKNQYVKYCCKRKQKLI